VHAILLAGGKGTRLAPHTAARPKALVELGGYPILEIILRRLRACGFERATLCVSHLREMIQAEIGDGRQLGLAVDYVVDERPLGTAAPLLLVPDWTGPAVVMNGDVLTTVDFTDLYRWHRAGESSMTVGYLPRSVSAAVGLLRVAGDDVLSLREKPSFVWNVCAGVYVADPLVRKYLPAGTPADMPMLVNALIAHGEPVRGYPVTGVWHDIGTPARYAQARTDFETDPRRFLEPRPGYAAAAPAAARCVEIELA
jgi:NDP-sugar pyrophosphorylase family protein